MLEVLITSNHLINEDLLYKKDENLSIEINDKKFWKLNLNNRIKYTSEEYDITIIEIKPNRDNIYNFLELDDKILSDIINNEIKEDKYSSIYQIFYSSEFRKVVVSFGMIYDSYEKTKFIFNCIGRQDCGFSGSPILDLNNKVIGINKDFNNEKCKYIGDFLNYPIKEFIQKNYIE